MSAGSGEAAQRLMVRDGRAVVAGVYVNGHGPFRFLLDTGSNVNLMDRRLASAIGMTSDFRVELGSATGRMLVSGSDENEISVDSVFAGQQKILFTSLDAIHRQSPDVQGVLGEWFLSRFDYEIDLRNGLLTFGRQDFSGHHTQFERINARPVVHTSLGDLVLDSGEAQLVLFGIHAADDLATRYELRTLVGAQRVGLIRPKPLVIDGEMVWSGNATTLSTRPESGVDGLLPLNLFKDIYVSNSEGYVILR